MDRINLNFERDSLYGFEVLHSDKKIGSLVKSINLGHELPLFRVHQFGINSYILSPDNFVTKPGIVVNDGGHSRAFSYYLAGIEFDCVLDDRLISPIPRRSFQISDFQLKFDEGEYDYRVRHHPPYMDLDESELFEFRLKTLKKFPQNWEYSKQKNLMNF